jgi:hypothetical protein
VTIVNEVLDADRPKTRQVVRFEMNVAGAVVVLQEILYAVKESTIPMIATRQPVLFAVGMNTVTLALEMPVLVTSRVI